MGSLMAGWSSNPLTAESVTVRSKSSPTKEEIEAFWRSRQKAMEEHLKDAAAQKLADHQQAESSDSGTGSAAAVPIPIHPAGSQVVVQELPKPSSIAASPDWWTRSNWAFLNDPPESHMNYAPGKYTAQFDVATKANYSDQLYTFQAGSSPIL